MEYINRIVQLPTKYNFGDINWNVQYWFSATKIFTIIVILSILTYIQIDMTSK